MPLPERPNVLVIYGEDCSPDYGCYGCTDVRTPHIDAFAAEGVRFTNAFVTGPVCSASRSAMITGCYQMRIGAHHHRSCRDQPLDARWPFVPDLFRAAGYFTCNSSGPPDYDGVGKTDWNFHVAHAFDGVDWSERAEGQPFYAQINWPDTHRMRRDNADRTLDPASVTIPPYEPDHPLTRRDRAIYLAQVQRFDAAVGTILARLDAEGLREQTIVFLVADHGRGMARDKVFLYDGGLRIPCIVRWPGGLAAGEVDARLVSGIDLGPTCLSLCGIDVPETMDGQPFLGHHAVAREKVFAGRDRCDGTEDRMRGVRTDRWKYIRNYFPERPRMQFNAYKHCFYPTWSLLQDLGRRGALEGAAATFAAPARAPEELYDLKADPDETVDLASDAAHADVRARLAADLDAWLASMPDAGAMPEPDAARKAAREEMERAFARWAADRGVDPPHDLTAWLTYWNRVLEP